MKHLRTGLVLAALTAGGCGSPSPIPAARPAASAVPSVVGAASAPADPAFAPRAEPRRLAAGDAHTCAVKDDGRVVCWGDNEHGQLGDGTLLARSGLTVVRGVADAVEVAAGKRFTCARTKKNEVFCWGGRGHDGPGRKQRADAAWKVTGLVGALEIDLGGDHGCARLERGRVACWGNPRGFQGQIGLSSSEPTTEAEVIAVDRVTGLAITGQESCARKDDGTVVCWGGHLTKDQVNIWVAAGVESAVDARGGDYDACLLTKAGKVLCGFDRKQPPRPPEDGAPAPTVDGLLAVGSNWGCFRENQSVTCWGNGPRERDAPPIGEAPFEKLANMPSPVELAAGSHHLCARLASGEIVCNGANDRGQLGFDDGRNAIRPAALADPTDVVSASAGDDQTCAIRKDGTVRCWGERGRLLAANTRGVYDVEGITQVRAVAVGSSHSCALHGAGEVACWGSGPVGELGDGPAPKPKPKPTPKPKAKAGEKAGARFGVKSPLENEALLGASFGALAAVGESRSGSGMVTAVKGVTGATSVAVADSFSCALTARGVSCWGWSGLHPGAKPTPRREPAKLGEPMPSANDLPKLPCGGFDVDADACAEVKKPRAIPNTQGATALVAARLHACVLLGTGKVGCWTRDSLAANTRDPAKGVFEVAGIQDAKKLRSAGRYVCTIDGAGKVGCFNPEEGAKPLVVYGDEVPEPVADIAETATLGMERHTCAAATSGRVYCWGNGDRGQLGHGAYELIASKPVRVEGIEDAVGVAVGSAHTCVVHKSGAVSCWGSPRSQVGVPAPNVKPGPFRID